MTSGKKFLLNVVVVFCILWNKLCYIALRTFISSENLVQKFWRWAKGVNLQSVRSL